MNSGNIEYVNLEELSNSDYKIVSGEADITGWPVKDEGGSVVGEVSDLLFDPEQNAIRYIVVNLSNQIAGIEEKAVLIPIGVANLAEDSKEVVIPVMSESQFIAMPRYIIGEVTRDTEMKIRAAIGSPAALRIEEEIVEMDKSEFYSHHHFDRGNIIGQHPTTTNHNQESITSDRAEETETIHQLINRAEAKKPIDNDDVQSAASKSDRFNINTDEGIFTIDPQENGTYRILREENKIGVIYAESGNEGIEWHTMDELDDHFVTIAGNAIHAHNTINSNS